MFQLSDDAITSGPDFRYSGIYPLRPGYFSIYTQAQGVKKSLNTMTGFEKTILPFLKSHLKPECDLRLRNVSGVQSVQPSYHAQHLQNSRGTCWNVSSPVDL